MKNYYVGQNASIKGKATKDVIELYGKASGDYNPIHFDVEYAKGTKFKGIVAHGLFCLGLISNLVGMKFPGEGSVFVSEDLKYLYPVYIEDEIEVTVMISEIDETKSRLILDIECKNQNNVLVMSGNAVVKI